MGASFWFITCTGILNQHFRVESKPVNTDIEGTIESIRINVVSVLVSVSVLLCPQGQSKLSIILRCPY